MAATLTQTLTPGHQVIPGRSVRPRTLGSTASVLAAIAFVGLLAAMAPGLAQAPVVGGTPRPLEAPATSAASSSSVVSHAAVSFAPTPEPGPDLGR